MGLNILDLLLPREVKFFKYMDQQATIFCEACKEFRSLVSQLNELKDEEIHARVYKIKELELRGDNIERFIIDQLNETFITPLDREDIHSIVFNIDKSLDILNNVAQKIEIYKIKKAPENFVTFANIIVDISFELQRLIKALKNKKDTSLVLKKIHILENEADHLFHTTMAELLNQKNDIVSMIKFKDIYENLEQIVNSVEFVAKLIRGVIVKQG